MSDNKREINSHDSLLSKITALAKGLNPRSAIGLALTYTNDKSHMDKKIYGQREASFSFQRPRIESFLELDVKLSLRRSWVVESLLLSRS